MVKVLLCCSGELQRRDRSTPQTNQVGSGFFETFTLDNSFPWLGTGQRKLQGKCWNPPVPPIAGFCLMICLKSVALTVQRVSQQNWRASRNFRHVPQKGLQVVIYRLYFLDWTKSMKISNWAALLFFRWGGTCHKIVERQITMRCSSSAVPCSGAGVP